MSPTYAEIHSLLKQRKNELQMLKPEEYLRFSSHVYILNAEVDLLSVLKELASEGLHEGQTPVLHLHIYCHYLKTTSLPQSELRIPTYAGPGCTLRSLTIYTAHLDPAISKIILSVGGQNTFRFNLYYEALSGPTDLRIAGHGDQVGWHILKAGDACVDPTEECRKASHLAMLDNSAIGICIQISPEAGKITSVVPTKSVPWQELRPLRKEDFAAFGEHAPRVQNLPRLLESLFESAGVALMGLQPNIAGILAKLRFIRQCAANASNFADLVTQTDEMQARLQYPKGFPQVQGAGDWFFVPAQTPTTLKSSMDATFTILIDQMRALQLKDAVQGLRDLIIEKSGENLRSITKAIGVMASQTRVDEERKYAEAAAKLVMNNMDNFKSYENQLRNAEEKFNAGIKKYREEKKKELIMNVIKGVFELGVSIGITLYTGGAGAPMTVGKFNESVNAANKLIKESSRLWEALKTLLKVLAKVGPKLIDAIATHKRGMAAGSGLEQDKSKLGLTYTADKITASSLASALEDIVDYHGLIAEWRQLDVATDEAFDSIAKELPDGDKISGMSEYKIAWKNLAIRGETVVNVLRDAYEGRRRYLLLLADQKARQAAINEINDLAMIAKEEGDNAKIAWMALKHRLQAELTQERRVAFMMIHEGVLALTYQTNNPKIQKNEFATLSPALDAEDLAKLWAKLGAMAYKDTISQSSDITLDTTDLILPATWKDLLINDLEFPFQIPTNLPALKAKHRMRITAISISFPGLVRTAGSDRKGDPRYTIVLGPLLLDRAQPYSGASRSEATIVQYYMPARSIHKEGGKGNLVNGLKVFADRALCCTGKVRFDREDVGKEKWDLTSVTGLEVVIGYEHLVFES